MAEFLCIRGNAEARMFKGHVNRGDRNLGQLQHLAIIHGKRCSQGRMAKNTGVSYTVVCGQYWNVASMNLQVMLPLRS
jgi:hypothetical protein